MRVRLPLSGACLDWITTVNKTIVRIGTRGSALALWQAQWVKERLEHAWPDLHVAAREHRTHCGVEHVRVRAASEQTEEIPPKNAAHPPRIVGRMLGRWFWMLATVTVRAANEALAAAVRFCNFFQNAGVGKDKRALISASMARGG